MIERKFIERGVRDLKVREFLEGEFERADFSHVEIHRTPLNTIITIHAGRPGIIIGRAGAKIKELTDTLAKAFGIENPVLEVKTVEKPELDPKIVARQIVSALERGLPYRRLANTYLRTVMEAGAIGVEIVISGKMAGERKRLERFVEGYIRKCGEPAEKYVEKGYAAATLKAGVIGVRVSIMRTLPPEMLLEKKIREIAPESLKLEEKKEEKPKRARKRKKTAEGGEEKPKRTRKKKAEETEQAAPAQAEKKSEDKEEKIE